MKRIRAKVSILSIVAVLTYGLILPLIPGNTFSHHTHSQAKAASSWKYLTTTSGNTKGRNLAWKMSTNALIALVAKGLGGSYLGTAAVGGLSTFSNGFLGTDKVLYYTDTIYERRTPVGPEWKHSITFYSNKAKTKKVGSGQVIQRTYSKAYDTNKEEIE
ncbi:hypothetical protein TP70_09875 [Staphylococcus microti]|uniref:Uncharacterized protein n=1 Tax=Staphylococcus microti TaxID=569857 RepID=A0A0D6XQ79_9STAP|nr:hypothetical protein [Staphylococcus microti]KIX90018.1 hypothetical protein TP70_09875 [Staphylococcus microti]PNZ79950.1 hypothetical protein CD132_08905 [Staphylococcus microti]SUM57095.1 Uncharacterised protein [Staphylococcus microti]